MKTVLRFSADKIEMGKQKLKKKNKSGERLINR